FIFWVTKFAAHSAWGVNLGLRAQVVVEWRGHQGWSWDRFMDLVLLGCSQLPFEILVIHLSDNDLAQKMGKALIQQIIADLSSLKQQFLRLQFLWSAIIPRKVWQVARDPRLIDWASREVNREVKQAVAAGLGSVVEHPLIRVECSKL
ncbi:hypothetical protein JRQ81_002980, partial [Phrynocephalus forsythii]